MRALHRCRLALLVIVLAFAAAAPAAADLTLLTHYTLVTGDTLTRPSYYSTARVRVTGPDGLEYMFDKKGKTVTVIDHVARTYWTGPSSRADSLAKTIMAANREGVPHPDSADAAEWGAKIKAFNDSLKVVNTGKTRTIAGYPCDEWMLTAGRFLSNQRWVARGLTVPNFGPEMQKTVMASVRDPLGRQLMRMLIDMRTKSGMVLAAKTTFWVPSRDGNFEFETLQVKSGTIPATAWLIPEGYTAVQL